MADEKNDDVPSSPDGGHFEPVILLPEVETKTWEEDEEELFKMRAKLYRYASNETPPEWKDRGTGDVKLLYNEDKGTVRLVMRREKTLKLCANHYVTPWMELKPNCGSDRAWVWSVSADYADEEPKSELLAIKFANAENAKNFKDKFEECKNIVLQFKIKEGNADFIKKLEALAVKENSSDSEEDDEEDEENDENKENSNKAEEKEKTETKNESDSVPKEKKESE